MNLHITDQVRHIHPSDIVYKIDVKSLNGFACAIEYVPADLLKIGDTIVYCHSLYKVTSIASHEDSNMRGLLLVKVE